MIGFLHGERGLLPHLGVHRIIGLRLESSGVHEQKALTFPFCLRVIAVTSHARHVLDDSEVSADDPVEQG
jgi:hypothetical protein